MVKILRKWTLQKAATYSEDCVDLPRVSSCTNIHSADFPRQTRFINTFGLLGSRD